MAGSGIATLINGGNFKDAFKSAAISGLTAGLMNGISGGMAASSGGGSFSKASGPAHLAKELLQEQSVRPLLPVALKLLKLPLPRHL